ncbi:MAG: hypothetical protein SFW09_17180 [Hyphomicrobiaceae bacterium]|nr:hypothetical protein [Hyphomicrobiaceae bacterium]
MSIQSNGVTRADVEAGVARGRLERSRAFHAAMGVMARWLSGAMRLGSTETAAADHRTMPVPY